MKFRARFATCTLGSKTISQMWAHEEPPHYNTSLNSSKACKAAGYQWYEAKWSHGEFQPPRCTWQNSHFDCKTGRCFDRGHIVPSGAAGYLFGRSGQTFSMCNIAAQTSLLNECPWMFVEQVVAQHNP